MPISVKITGTGHFLPGKPIPFGEVDSYLGSIEGAPPKTDKWFRRIKPLMSEMLDIDFYHFAIDSETGGFTEDNVSMSVKAALKALEKAKLKASDIDFIAYGSAHQHQMPTASVRIQEALGIEHCAEISIHANCTSAYKALMVAFDGIRLGRYKKALVLSSGMSSSELRSSYYNMALVRKEELFLRYFLSDGAGALILEADVSNQKSGLYLEHCHNESIGGKKPSAMGNKRPAYYLNPKYEYDHGLHHLAQMFNEDLSLHFNEADGSVFIKGLKRMLVDYPIELNRIKYFQVNFPSKHISEMIMDECEGMGIGRHTLYTKLQTMGYTGPPMVFMCLDKIMNEEAFNKGDILISFVTEVSKFMQAGFICRYY
ncbi:MAG: 3-oxoacyl-ACP synthase III family protein [Bacteroidales bacterium]|nr:3-oxoacyl-ACP synthase III family protein [Bacteroidales bacterium]